MSLQTELRQFTGTENYYRHSLGIFNVPKFVYTDGVAHFLIKAEAYWFMDIVSTDIHKLKKDFAVVELHSYNNKALITAKEDDGLEPYFSKEISFTDCPEGTYKFFYQKGSLDGVNIEYVFMLPSEY